MCFSFKPEVLKITSRFSFLKVTVPNVFLRMVLSGGFLSLSARLSWVLEVLHFILILRGLFPVQKGFRSQTLYPGLCKASRPLGGAFAPRVSSLQPGSSLASLRATEAGQAHLLLTRWNCPSGPFKSPIPIMLSPFLESSQFLLDFWRLQVTSLLTAKVETCPKPLWQAADVALVSTNDQSHRTHGGCLVLPFQLY